MRLAVFGRTGQLATELQRRAPDGVEVTALGRDAADFSDPESVRAAAAAVAADAIINAVAYTAVDRAEEEEALATVVNGVSVGALAEVAAARGLPLVHVSTDYVFDGSGERPWRPDDPTAPLGAYGRSKLAGETAVRAAGGPHVILRTAWVFSAHGGNFVKTMLRLGASRDEVSVVCDQWGGPTPAADIADTCFTLAVALRDGAPGGTHHFAGAPDTTWARFARETFSLSGLKCRVNEIPTSGYPTPARRPANSRLDCTLLTETYGIARPDWRVGLDTVLKELGAT